MYIKIRSIVRADFFIPTFVIIHLHDLNQNYINEKILDFSTYAVLQLCYFAKNNARSSN